MAAMISLMLRRAAERRLEARFVAGPEQRVRFLHKLESGDDGEWFHALETGRQRAIIEGSTVPISERGAPW